MHAEIELAKLHATEFENGAHTSPEGAANLLASNQPFHIPFVGLSLGT